MDQLTTQERIRAAMQDIRRKSYPISDLIPMLAQAADELDAADQKKAIAVAEAFSRGHDAAWQTASITGWQPIETAPKDNSRVLYLARFSESGELAEIDYDGVWEFWQESYEMPHICGYDWCSASGIEEPTHWAYQYQPIPRVKQSVADYMWTLLADYCKKRGLNPHHENDLFSMVKQMREYIDAQS